MDAHSVIYGQSDELVADLVFEKLHLRSALRGNHGVDLMSVSIG